MSCIEGFRLKPLKFSLKWAWAHLGLKTSFYLFTSLMMRNSKRVIKNTYKKKFNIFKLNRVQKGIN